MSSGAALAPDRDILAAPRPALLVEARGLGKTFGSGEAATVAVRDATFTIEAGAGIALMGPSGSGKSTLLHLIAGLEQPSSGTIGWPALGGLAALRPGLVSLAFQSPSLLAPLTVLENVAVPLLLAGRGETDSAEAARAMLERMDMEILVDKLPEELSGGQAQRIGMARALVSRPALLLADEPTGQQDRENGVRLLDLMLKVAAGIGTAVLVATHDETVGSRLARRWSMEDGYLRVGAA
jgi:ABC-type lipoprotein export system ATPase subunit